MQPIVHSAPHRSVFTESSARSQAKRDAQHRVAQHLLLLALLCIGACAPATADTSLDATLRRYRQALRSNHAQAAYDLLSLDQQAQRDKDLFAQIWAARDAERAVQLNALSSFLPSDPRKGSAQVRTDLRLNLSGPGSPPVELLLATDRDGHWRLSHAGLAAPSTDTPEAALRGLLRAMEQRSFSAIFRLLSLQTRQAVEEELRERIERLRAALQVRAPPRISSPTTRQNAEPKSASPPSSQEMRIEIQGSHARIQYDPRFFIDLVREADGWRIRDMN
jgi:hypothetical protein